MNDAEIAAQTSFQWYLASQSAHFVNSPVRCSRRHFGSAPVYANTKQQSNFIYYLSVIFEDGYSFLCSLIHIVDKYGSEDNYRFILKKL